MISKKIYRDYIKVGSLFDPVGHFLTKNPHDFVRRVRERMNKKRGKYEKHLKIDSKTIGDNIIKFLTEEAIRIKEAREKRFQESENANKEV